MSESPSRAELLALLVAERLELIEELWGSIEADIADLPLPEWQRAELDRRLDELGRAPDAGSTWDVARKRILGRK